MHTDTKRKVGSAPGADFGPGPENQILKVENLKLLLQGIAGNKIIPPKLDAWDLTWKVIEKNDNVVNENPRKQISPRWPRVGNKR